MAALRPVQVFGLSIPPGEEAVPALGPGDLPVTFRVTMAAIDPTITSQEYAQVNGVPAFTGSTLRLIRIPMDDEDDDDDEDDSEDEDDFDIQQFLGDISSDEDDEDEDDADSDDDDEEEVNGGPSDPSKSPKARREAARRKFREALAIDGHDMEIDDGNEDDDDDDDEEDDEDEDEAAAAAIARLTAKQKGKAKVLGVEDMDDSDDDDDMSAEVPEEMVICTLDLSRNYQQPLDITINEHETVLFQASGTHTVYLTGNILIPEDLPAGPRLFDPEDDEEEDYDLSPDEDELDLPEDDESDELDDLDDPRVLEIDSEEDIADMATPKATQGTVAAQKNKKKRAHQDSSDEDEDEATTLDDLLNKSLKPTAPVSAQPKVNGEQQLSKAQQKKLRKKLKANGGDAVEMSGAIVEEDHGVPEVKMSESPATNNTKSDKKVQFAKTLVQGPSGAVKSTTDTSKPNSKAKVEGKPDTPAVNGLSASESKPAKPTLGVKVVQGVTLDDKKLGSGPVAKKGDQVSMRYIGKLEKDKKVFDSNKKGKPFTFQLGASHVIKGWDIGVQGMAVGGERRITVPPQLGYGSKAQGNDIPSNSTLVFDVKLLNIA